MQVVSVPEGRTLFVKLESLFVLPLKAMEKPQEGEDLRFNALVPGLSADPQSFLPKASALTEFAGHHMDLAQPVNTSSEDVFGADL